MNYFHALCSYQNFDRFFSEFLYRNELKQFVQIGEKESEDKSVNQTERKPERDKVTCQVRQTEVCLSEKNPDKFFERRRGRDLTCISMYTLFLL